ncbi:MAG: carbohydrate-binding domain-containing protein [Planctomycetota bacterium]
MRSPFANDSQAPEMLLACEPLEPRLMLSTVEIIAAGVTNQETMQLQIDGATVQVYENVGGNAYGNQFQTYRYDTVDSLTADQIRIAFTNDLFDPDNGVDRNLRVDAILIDGVRYETESPNVFSTGTWRPEDGIVDGFRTSEYLHTDGYFQFADQSSGSQISIRARGNEGVELFQLKIDGTLVQQFETTDQFQVFEYTADEIVSADQIRIDFINDQYDPANGVDNNLFVDHIVIDGETFETEAPTTFSTGTWRVEDGIQSGYRQSEILHTNGYFQFATAPAEPGIIGLTLDSLTINEDLGELNFVIFRSGGSDGQVTVDYETAFDSATSEDVSAASGQLVFGDGVTSLQVTLNIVDDSEIETDETFQFVISRPTNGATLGPITTQSVTIVDNDAPATGIIFEDRFDVVSNWTVDPFGTDTATTGAWEIGSPQQTTSNGVTLQPNSGFNSPGALVTGLASGSSVGSFDIDNGVTSVLSPLVELPAGAEIELSYVYSFAYLENATNADFFRVSVLSNGVVTEIFDDHAHSAVQAGAWIEKQFDLSPFAGNTVQLLIEAADLPGGSLVESAVDNVVIEVLPNLPGTINVGTTSVNLDEDSGVAEVTLVRSSGRVGTVSIQYATSPGSASNSDFVPVSGTAIFADGQAELTVQIPIVDDSLEESLESFELILSDPTGGAILGNNDRAVVTIVDNDNSVLDYLPDLTPIASTLTERLSIDTNEIPGRTLLRFSTEVANAGDGPLEIWGGSVSGVSQQVFQRIYQEDGGSRDSLAGEFVYHASHGHIHFEGFATYDLILTDASGEIVASGGKTSFCLINIRQPLSDVTAAAGLVHGRGGSSCGQVQGISTGYSDVYSASLDDQWIDVTDVPDGTYWLEIETDPDNHIQETNESNNTARVQITINNGNVTSG